MITMENSNIDSSNPGIVATEVQVNISDEKLRGLLLRTYEEALKNERTVSYYDWCSVLLSISGTIFLALITSSFNDVGMVSAAVVTIIAWVICIGSFLIGCGFLYKKYSVNTSGDTEKRDEAVDRIMRQSLSQSLSNHSAEKQTVYN